jgi:LacI family gluconate utilization system Gnt-I transcriptional repressor
LQTLLGVYGWSSEREAEIVNAFIGRQVDAVVLNGFTHSAEVRSKLRRYARPVVETCNLRPDPIDMAAGYDNRMASYEMTKYLLARSYRAVAAVGEALHNNDQAQDRRNGFMAAMQDAGRSVHGSHVLAVARPSTVDAGYQAMIQLLDTTPRPDAVFFQADVLAHGAVMACLSRGIAIPGTMAIAGFGDLALSARLPVPLTTVKARAQAIGRETARLVLARLAARTSDIRTVDVGYEILVRASA